MNGRKLSKIRKGKTRSWRISYSRSLCWFRKIIAATVAATPLFDHPRTSAEKYRPYARLRQSAEWVYPFPYLLDKVHTRQSPGVVVAGLKLPGRALSFYCTSRTLARSPGLNLVPAASLFRFVSSLTLSLARALTLSPISSPQVYAMLVNVCRDCAPHIRSARPYWRRDGGHVEVWRSIKCVYIYCSWRCLCVCVCVYAPATGCFDCRTCPFAPKLLDKCVDISLSSNSIIIDTLSSDHQLTSYVCFLASM